MAKGGFFLFLRNQSFCSLWMILNHTLPECIWRAYSCRICGLLLWAWPLILLCHYLLEHLILLAQIVLIRWVIVCSWSTTALLSWHTYPLAQILLRLSVSTKHHIPHTLIDNSRRILNWIAFHMCCWLGCIACSYGLLFDNLFVVMVRVGRITALMKSWSMACRATWLLCIGRSIIRRQIVRTSIFVDSLSSLSPINLLLILNQIYAHISSGAWPSGTWCLLWLMVHSVDLPLRWGSLSRCCHFTLCLRLYRIVRLDDDSMLSVDHRVWSLLLLLHPLHD
jgi:hypothetical protein